MQTRRTGAWLIGGRGSVATTAMTGAAAVAAGLAPATGLVTETEPFAEAGLPALGDLVFGGHDVVETPLAVARRAPGRRRRAARRAARARSRRARGRRGRAAARASPAARRARSRAPRSPAIVADLDAFRDAPRPRRASSSSTSPRPRRRSSRTRRTRTRTRCWTRCDRGLGVLPPSALYALAAIETGLRVRRLHAVGRRAAARARGAGRGARGAARPAATARPARRS